MTTYNLGDVVVAMVLFSNQDVAKPRPAVIVSDENYNKRKPDVIIASITSNLNADRELGEFLLTDLKSAGLKVPSRTKAFITTIAPRVIKYKIGHFSDKDSKALQLMLGTLFAS
ncbi:MAG: type II toxin-antitoxin system PemK/MazF family toxin [Pseudomonadota bacterium]|nr:type II toxin-antitoxin system PemK/MazF family toxin [Pseudomonadota bacterium]MDE3038584.1 type II toxin-antitoxin system PemK/MazF family toxin [Pseudomonadota bacterium]